MKRTVLTLALVIVMASGLNASAATILVKAKLHIAGCSQPPVLTLLRTADPDVNSGQFNRIVITVGARTFRFDTKTPQVKPSVLNPPVDYAKVKGISVDPSGFFLRARYFAGSTKRSLLIFLGWPYASDPGSLLILGFKSDCKPYRVFQSDTFELDAIQNDASGSTSLIGMHSMSEIIAGDDWPRGKPYASTYDPYSVYRINPTMGLAEYSLEDSKRYNQTHYCWAGPHASESKAVVYNLTKKSSVECMSADRAQDLIR